MNRTPYLVFHIVCGFVALAVGLGAVLTKKGGRAHRLCGRIYVWSMGGVALSAVILTTFFGSPRFLFYLAILAFYAAHSGRRALARKRPTDRATLLDWGGTLIVGGAGVALLVWAAQLWRVGETGFAPVGTAFGALALTLAVRDGRSYLRPPERNGWWFAHMGAMLGAYVATVTAFSAVNFHFLPIAVRWLWPAVIGTVGIPLWVRSHRRRFARPAVKPAT